MTDGAESIEGLRAAVADARRRGAALSAELSTAREQQTATAAVPRVIAISPIHGSAAGGGIGGGAVASFVAPNGQSWAQNS